MSDHWPLLDIRDALKDADQFLQEAADRIETLLGETEGHYPSHAQQCLANIAAVREQLGWVVPPVMRAEITAEQAGHDEEEARWEASLP